ncbi:hypothetical protein, partial [Nostoc sp. UHCC 0251]|uniref:hypothetical protein n=1 Tax=Nostoc sp. UHCC 0251 TaxID=3110240 RepID=UPI002B1F9FE6
AYCLLPIAYCLLPIAYCLTRLYITLNRKKQAVKEKNSKYTNIYFVRFAFCKYLYLILASDRLFYFQEAASMTRCAQQAQRLLVGRSHQIKFEPYLDNFGYITANALILYFLLFINSAKTPLRYLHL